jgi:hypothetical protein
VTEVVAIGWLPLLPLLPEPPEFPDPPEPETPPLPEPPWPEPVPPVPPEVDPCSAPEVPEPPLTGAAGELEGAPEPPWFCDDPPPDPPVLGETFEPGVGLPPVALGGLSVYCCVADPAWASAGTKRADVSERASNAALTRPR